MDGRILPEPFQLAYEMLWTRCYSDGGPGAGVGSHPLDGRGSDVEKASGKAEHEWRTSTGQVTRSGKAGPKSGAGKAVGKTSRVLKDEQALELKKKVDKDLRRIAARLRAFEEGRNVVNAGQRVCVGKCKRFGEIDWTYCARCGGPMRDLERDE